MPVAAELGISNVLDVVQTILGLEGELHGDEYRIPCPNPGHMDSSPSCDVNVDSGKWKCFSCGVGGDLLDLTVVVRDLPNRMGFERIASRDQALDIIRPCSQESVSSIVSYKLERALARRPRAEPLPPLPGPYEDGPLTYMRKERGFSQATLERFGVRWVPEETLMGKKGPFTITNSVAIPIRGERGELLNWCYRATPTSASWQPRYLYFHEGIKDTWFGVDHHSTEDHITIVEGALDAMWCDQCGFPALAMLGAGIGDKKILWLQRYKSITILGDRDAGGLAAVQKIGTMLGERIPVRVARYPKWVGDDPQELAGVDLEIMHHRSIPWSTWLLRQTTATAAVE